MSFDDQYSVWKRRRSQVDVGRGFADRVMERVGAGEPPWHCRAAAAAKRSPHRFAWRLQVAAAVFVVGLSVGLIRSSSIIVFLLLSASRGY